MKSQIDDQVARALARPIETALRRPGLIVVLCSIITLLAGVYAFLNLGVDTDNVKMISSDVPSRKSHEAFVRLFPNLEDALLIVVDGATPELARDGATRLVARLRERSDRFTDAYMPDGGDFFETHGLLYRSVEELEEFGDQMARLQPIVAGLEQDPSIANLASMVQTGLEQTIGEDAADSSVNPEDWAFILDSVGEATVAVYSEFPLTLSWEQMLLQGSAVETVRRRVIIANPILDFGSLLAAGEAMRAIREEAAALGLSPETGVEVRVTGNPALNYEEMLALAWDLGFGGVACFLAVLVVLGRALRSLALVIAAVVTLLAGLVWTAAFAAGSVGALSLVSAAFGVLFIGLGVDFAIHLGMAYAAQLRLGGSHAEALRTAVGSVGGSLALCSLTTVIGFFVFLPTHYRGVAQLGLIAGTGVVIIFALTLTLFPALLSGPIPVDIERARQGRELHFRSTWWRVFDTHPGLVLIVALLLFAGALTRLPDARFDLNVIAMRDPTTESVQAFDDLLAQSGPMSPWYADSVAPDLEAAQILSARMRALDVVSHTISISDYVPENQDEKLAILADVAFMMDTLPPLGETEKPSFERQIDALRGLYLFLDEGWLGDAHSVVADSVRMLKSRLGDFLARVDADEDPEAALKRLETLLLSGLPDQLARLRRAVNTAGIGPEDLPEELVARMVAKTGEVRVQTFPRYDLSDDEAFARFTDAVSAVDPNATGTPVNLVAFGRAVRTSFQQALLSAVVLISLLLVVLWRRLLPMLLVMAPLLLASVLTVASMAMLDIPFNFGNVIVVPLLLGIGVDSGIHLVHRAQELGGHPGDLMDSTTARAVFYSALTTTVSFGTLAFSSHRGVASLGIVLTIGMLLTVASNLIVLPALLHWTRGRGGRI